MYRLYFEKFLSL